jgi:glycosyltransferase involved in cell wall biosynthesis
MKLSFVIPAYNEEHYIGDCLDSILKQKTGAPCEVEIVVVNNASTDGTATVITRRYPEVKLVNEPQKGLVFARRAGFLAATGDLIAQVDADSRLTPDWIKKVAAAFTKDKELVGLSGPYIYYDLPALKRFWVWVFYIPTYISYLVNHFVLHTGSVLLGGNCIVRRDALKKIGGYDTNIEFYGEDTDLARRMSKVGKVVFTFSLPMYTSGRRLAKEGTFTTGLRYSMNYLWIILFKKPFSKAHEDIRPKEEKTGE